MIYSLNLQTVGLLVGLLLLISHLAALFSPRLAQDFLKALPRSKAAGFVLLTAAAAWACWLLSVMDLGEFTGARYRFVGLTLGGYFVALFWLKEFLAVRALGMLLLLAAEPLVEAAFLRPEMSRLFLTGLAYVWVVLGMFWIGKPYLLRDQLEWVSRTPLRWRLAALGGAVYGAVLTGFACAWPAWS